MLATTRLQSNTPTAVLPSWTNPAASGKPRVLVLENDPYISAIIWTLLNHFNFDVISETSGREGWQLARNSRPDIVVLNVDLPGMNGLEICHQLKTEPDTRATPVVFCSGQGYLAGEALLLGAAAFLDNPNDVMKLPHYLRQILSAQSTDGSKHKNTETQ
jgi:DNA-binding response OmpR family regulator